MKIRSARKNDADQLVKLIDIAGEGIPTFIWSELAVGNQKPMDVGLERASREEGAFSYLNAQLATQNDEVAGMIIAYGLPKPYLIGDITEYSEVIRPLILLEAQAGGSWYINGLAVFETFRKQGIAKNLIEKTKLDAKERGYHKVSLIVSRENSTAVKLYETLGFRVAASEPVFPHPRLAIRGEWQLMTLAL